jgi:hypothetical protein
MAPLTRCRATNPDPGAPATARAVPRPTCLGRIEQHRGHLGQPQRRRLPGRPRDHSPTRGCGSESGCGRFEFGRAPASDEEGCAAVDETTCCGRFYPAAAAGDDRCLASPAKRVMNSHRPNRPVTAVADKSHTYPASSGCRCRHTRNGSSSRLPFAAGPQIGGRSLASSSTAALTKRDRCPDEPCHLPPPPTPTSL